MPTYQKKNWHAAEPITADAINNLENGMERIDGEIETLQGAIEDLQLMNPTVEQLSTAMEINNKATYLPNSWALKTSISTIGNEGNISTFALSDYIHMNKGDVITYTGELTDGTNSSNNDYVCYLAIFDDTKTFENRNNQILFSNNTTCNYTMAKDGYIRLMFGRPSDSQKEIELSDVNKCCIDILHPSIVALREDLNKVIPTNLYAGGAFTYLRTIKVADGTVGTSQNSNVCITNYIDISNCSSLVYSRCIVTTSTPTVTGMAFYDVNKDNTRFTNNNEGSITGGAEGGFTLSEIAVPEYAKYARFTWNSNYGEFILYNGEDYNNSIKNKVEILTSQVVELKEQEASDNIANVDSFSCSVSSNEIGKMIAAGQKVDIYYKLSSGRAFPLSVKSTLSGNDYTIEATFMTTNADASGCNVYIFTISGTSATRVVHAVNFDS